MLALLGFFLTGVWVGIITFEVNVNRINLIYFPLIFLCGYGIWKVTERWKKLLPFIGTAYIVCFVLFLGTYFTTFAGEIGRMFNVNFLETVKAADEKEEYEKLYITGHMDWQYNLSMAAVGSAIAGSDFDLPAGEVTLGAQDVALNVEGSFTAGPGIQSFPIQTPSGQLVRLDDVAQAIYLAKEEAENVSRYNGQESVLLNVTKQDSVAAVGICGQVLEVLDGFQDDGIRFEIINNEADNILEALRCVLETILTGILLAMIVLFLFFGDWKASLVVGVSMPLSVFLAVILLNSFGFDLNVMSGTGLILAIGMIVDNSIVILESCFRAHEEGLEFREAAAQGTSSMLMSILAGTLTTVVVYLPLAMSSGLAGMLFGPLLWTIVLTMLASFLCAVVVVPPGLL